ncbi:MAG: hypothetical protein OEU92_24475, partial [Alphaproteobacteria bacterium]|nr:hypothetical protein [Alphaproteobacteria bacterium]
MAPSKRNKESGQPDKAVIVVHGIGDQLQGDTLERLVTSYVVNAKKTEVDAAHIEKSTLRLRTHAHTLEEERDSGEERLHIDTFKADVLKTKHLPDVIFAEVYWADISRIMAGVFGFLIGAFKILTGLRFVVEAAGDSLVSKVDVWSTRFVRGLGNGVNRGLVGPLVALNALLFFVVLIAHWFDSIIWQHVAFGVLSAIFLLSIHLLAQAKYLLGETKWDAIVAYIIFAAILLLGSPLEFTGDYIDIIEWISDVFWSLLSVGLFFLVAASAVVFSSHREARPSLTIACAGPCLNVGLWALALSNVWIVGLNNILPEVDAHSGDGGLVFRLFPLLSILWGAILAFGLTLFGVFYYRNKVAARRRQPPGETWRLIFSRWAALVMIVVVVSWFLLTIFAWAPVFPGQIEVEASALQTIRTWTKDNLGLVAVL